MPTRTRHDDDADDGFYPLSPRRARGMNEHQDARSRAMLSPRTRVPNRETVPRRSPIAVPLRNRYEASGRPDRKVWWWISSCMATSAQLIDGNSYDENGDIIVA